MNWWGAMAWAEQLGYGGFSDWRLPTVSPINGSAFSTDRSEDGSTDVGYNISAPGTVYAGGTGSELAYMYYNNLLGNVPYCSTGGVCPQPGWTGVVSPSFVDATTGQTKAFENLSYWFWSGTEFAPGPMFAWEFSPYLGSQDINGWGGKDYNFDLGWAVRPGDVPLPGAGLLLMSALVGLGWAHRPR